MKKAGRLAWLPLLAGAGPVHAHSPVPGIEGIYVGAIHPFSTPSHVLLMVGLGLLAGAHKAEIARWMLAGFLGACLCGLVFGPRDGIGDATVFAMAFITCSFTALFPRRLLPLAIGLICVGGVMVGVLSIPDDGPARDRIFTMSGSFVGANLGLLYLFGICLVIRERCPWPWVDIAFRVAAAWLAAIALLMLALGFAQPATLS